MRIDAFEPGDLLRIEFDAGPEQATFSAIVTDRRDTFLELHDKDGVRLVDRDGRVYVVDDTPVLGLEDADVFDHEGVWAVGEDAEVTARIGTSRRARP